MLKILITNNSLMNRGGSELYVRDLAAGLLARGHEPLVFSTHLGEVATAVRRSGVAVVDDLRDLAWSPEVIHGQHHLDMMIALLHFPNVPAISVCHGWLPWEETPLYSSRILRYVAIDHCTRDRLSIEHGIPSSLVRLIPNFVDLKRFRPREPLPDRPGKALILNHHATENTFVPAVRRACDQFGIDLDVRGCASGEISDDPETLLKHYDLVFATGRTALEALAVGTAVVLCHIVGAGPLVTTKNFDRLRQNNFGLRELQSAVHPDALAAEIALYDPNDAAEVSNRVRREAGSDDAIERLIELYREALAESQKDRSLGLSESETREASVYLRGLVGRIKERPLLKDHIQSLEAECKRCHRELEQLRLERDALVAENKQLRDIVTEFAETRVIRWRDALLRLPLVPRLFEASRRAPRQDETRAA